MPLPKFEVLVGVVDGVNRLFAASGAYTPGTTAVFLNGQLKRPHGSGIEDGWVETDPVDGVVTLDEAPRPPGDVVQMFYLDTTPPVIVVEAGPEPITGRVTDVDRLGADLLDVDEYVGDVAVLSTRVDGLLDDVGLLCGSVEYASSLSATLEIRA